MELPEYDDYSDCVFNFETDHLALRGNPEYSKIMRTIALLEAQTIKIHRDIEQIIHDKNKYVNDPICLVRDIFENNFISPKYIRTISMPSVRLAGLETNSENEIDGKFNPDVKVRGRIFDQTKPETFNQLWTCEEQRRLEQLLIEYPVEPIEMRRFTKIALALGNRTPQQVASRVQKFFKKLQSVGMPVPGRIPKNKKSSVSKSKHFYKSLYRQSTFFPAHDVPVNIPDEEMFSVERCTSIQVPDFKSTEKEAENEENVNFKKRLIEMLKVMRADKVCTTKEQKMRGGKCNNCTGPVSTENRWFCKTCCCCINMCDDCMIYKCLNISYEHHNHDILIAQ